MHVDIWYTREAMEPVVSVSNWKVGKTSTVILLEATIKLEKASNCRFTVEKVMFELFDTVPTVRPLPPLYRMLDSTNELRNVIAPTEEIKTWEFVTFIFPARSMKIFCFAA
jgi:hypothetical protein